MGKGDSSWYVNPDTDCLYVWNDDGRFILSIKDGKLVRKSVDAFPFHAERIGINWSDDDAIAWIRSNMERD